jgi:hypothetical protein
VLAHRRLRERQRQLDVAPDRAHLVLLTEADVLDAELLGLGGAP